MFPAGLQQVLWLCRRPLMLCWRHFVCVLFLFSSPSHMMMTATSFSNLQSSLQSEPNMFHLRLQVTDSIRFEDREMKINKFMKLFLLNLENINSWLQACPLHIV